MADGDDVTLIGTDHGFGQGLFIVCHEENRHCWDVHGWLMVTKGMILPHKYMNACWYGTVSDDGNGGYTLQHDHFYCKWTLIDPKMSWRFMSSWKANGYGHRW